MSDELRAERAKATAALQERARLRIEIEGMKHRQEQILRELSDAKTLCDSGDAEKRLLRQRISDLEMKLGSNKEENSIMESKWLEAKRLYEEEKHRTTLLLSQSEQTNLRMRSHTATAEAFEGRIQDASRQIAELQSELERSQRTQISAEQKYEYSSEVVQEQARDIAQLHGQVSNLEKLGIDYNHMKLTNENLRQDLEESINRNVQLTAQMHEVAAGNHQASSKEMANKEHILELELERDRLLDEAKSGTATFQELQKRLAAETEVAEASKLRADYAIKARQSYEDQVDELRLAHESVLDARNRIEAQLIEAGKANEGMRAELMASKDRNVELESRLVESDGAQKLSLEVEFLRSQLSELRKQQAKREVDEEAGSLAPKAILERETHSRKMYEGIIVEIRAELERSNTALATTTLKLEEASRRAGLCEQLEEQVRVYKDAAKMSAVETHSVGASMSEAYGRVEALRHEKETFQRELRRVETELVSTKAEIHRIKEDLQGERQVSRERHLEKLQAERRAAELVASKSRVDTKADMLQQECGKLTGENALLKAKFREMESSMNTLRSKLDAANIEHLKRAELQDQLRRVNQEFNEEKANLLGELQTTSVQKETQKREMDAMNSTLQSLRHSLDDANLVIDNLREECADVRRRSEATGREIATQDKRRAELQLEALREELEQTMHSWKDAEAVRQDKDELTGHLRSDLARERERANLLKSQVHLMEERLHTSLQELSVYRSIDVYQSGIKQELANSNLRLSSSSTSTNPDGRERNSVSFGAGIGLGVTGSRDMTAHAEKVKERRESERRESSSEMAKFVESERQNDLAKEIAREQREAAARPSVPKFTLDDLKDIQKDGVNVGLEDTRPRLSSADEHRRSTVSGGEGARRRSALTGLGFGSERDGERRGGSAATPMTGSTVKGISAIAAAAAVARDRESDVESSRSASVAVVHSNTSSNSKLPNKLDFERAKRMMMSGGGI